MIAATIKITLPVGGTVTGKMDDFFAMKVQRVVAPSNLSASDIYETEMTLITWVESSTGKFRAVAVPPGSAIEFAQI